MEDSDNGWYARDILGVWLGFFAYHLLVVLLTSPRNERLRRLRFVCVLYPQNLTVVLARFAVMRLSKLSSPLYWPLILPIGVFETWSVQAMADALEGRPQKAVTLDQVTKQIKVAACEAVGLTIGFKLWPWVTTDGPNVASLIHSIWRAAVFDTGLDLGFYTFHRLCHKNRVLYRHVHSDHHTTPGKTYGHLVAHETYDLSVVETVAILGSYLIGFELIGLLYKYTLFDIALLVSWAHLLELLGHSQIAWSVNGHPLRILPEMAGIHLKIPDHTMHHTKPLSNFSKRLTLFDRMFQTYSPPEDAYGTCAGDADGGATTKLA